MASKRSVAFGEVEEGDVGVLSPQAAQHDSITARKTARRMIQIRYYLTRAGQMGCVARQGGWVGEERGVGGIRQGANWPYSPDSPYPPHSPCSPYLRCLFTSFVISNMLTDDLPPNTAFSEASPLIIRLFFLSCSPFFLM